MPFDPPTFIRQLAAGGEVLLLLLGLGLLARYGFSGPLRATWRRPSPLAAVPWSVVEFGLAIIAVIGGGVAGQIIAQLIASQIGAAPDLTMLILGAGFQGGLLVGVGVARTAAISPLPRPLDEAIGSAQVAAPVESAALSAPETPLLPPASATPVLLAGTITLLIALPLLLAVSLSWTFLLTRLGLDTSKQSLVDIFSETQSPTVLVGMSLLAVVVAPLAEETIFRAGLFRYLRTRLPRPVALALPAVVFGSLHQNLVAFVPLVVLGVIFALAYERTGRIAVPIIAHALFNLHTILLLLAGVDL